MQKRSWKLWAIEIGHEPRRWLASIVWFDCPQGKDGLDGPTTALFHTRKACRDAIKSKRFLRSMYGRPVRVVCTVRRVK